MQKLILSVAFSGLASFMCQLHSQSISNKTWKTYIDAPINDTTVFHIYPDSSFITNGAGEIMVRLQSKISRDTLTILDFGTEDQGCTGIKGSYKINLAGDSFTLTTISDPCAGRSQAFAGRKWIEATKK